MWFDKRERFIRKILRQMGRQRVAGILQPHNVWLVDYGVMDRDPGVAEALRTCQMRGWVEVVENAVPRADLVPDAATGEYQLPQEWTHKSPMFRLTDSGWNQIHGLHTWIVFTAVIGLVTLIVTVAASLPGLLELARYLARSHR
jgi:hypothetical protein